MQKTNGLLKKVFLTTLFAVFLYALLLLYADARKVLNLLASFDLKVFTVLLLLSLFCYVTRTIRLKYLVTYSDYEISIKDSFYIQFSGMTMTITPGKIGEVLKAFLLREMNDYPLSKGVALVFVERLSDFVAVLILSIGGITAFKSSYLGISIIFALTIAGIIVLSTPYFQELLLRVIEKAGFFRKYHASLKNTFEAVRFFLKPVPLSLSILLAVFGWGAEGVAFYLTLKALGFFSLDILKAVAVYSISTIAGALAMFPGGLGLTEGSMMGILLASGASKGISFSATMIIRFTTLWFGVITGWLVFISRKELFRKFTFETKEIK